jgi:hypothetical protein
MPIAPGPVTQPPSAVAQNVIPLGQRVLPVEPARRVTPGKEARGSDVDPERKRRRQPDERGGKLDLEV